MPHGRGVGLEGGEELEGVEAPRQHAYRAVCEAHRDGAMVRVNLPWRPHNARCACREAFAEERALRLIVPETHGAVGAGSHRRVVHGRRDHACHGARVELHDQVVRALLRVVAPEGARAVLHKPHGGLARQLIAVHVHGGHVHAQGGLHVHDHGRRVLAHPRLGQGLQLEDGLVLVHLGGLDESDVPRAHKAVVARGHDLPVLEEEHLNVALVAGPASLARDLKLDEVAVPEEHAP
mmetsp:Transcript_5889/g.17499  ORF Transcript_5889/g.17499 Transcript_5889/m.17499 type:complete len:236 (+) Transcript_5889:2206-2913(+)